MRTKLLCFFLFVATISFGQNDTSEVFISPDEDWRILYTNGDNGFAYYFNPDRIWTKGSLFSCNIKVLVDSAHLMEFQRRVGKKYDHSVYQLQVDCKQAKLKVIGLAHYDNKGELITLPEKNKNQFALDKYQREHFIKEVCKQTKVPWFDAKRESPF